MASIHQFQRRAAQIKPSLVRKNLFKYIRSIEKLFFDLNIAQIEDSKNAKDKLLKHSNTDLFSGVYAESTQGFADLDGISTPKRAGDPYNFLWSGEFISGFELFVKNGDIELFSTGTGGGEKAKFFKGYKDLFGLTNENLREVINTELLPFFLAYYKKSLKI